jgi:hypothetical protein
MRNLQRYRMRVPSTGREVIVDAEPDVVYIDKQTGEHLEPIAQLTPVAPTPSNLPWALENLRFCPHCDQFCQKDLSVCPVCGKQMDPLV